MGLLPGAPGLLVFLSGLLCHSSLVEPHLVPRYQPRVVAQCVNLKVKVILATRQHAQRAPNPMRQPTRGRESPPPLSLPCSSDDLDLRKFSHARVRFVARTPAGMSFQEALPRFARAAAKFLRDQTEEDDEEDGRLTAQRAFASQRSQTVTQPFVISPAASDRLRDAVDSNSWVHLPGWGGEAAVFFGDGPALKQYSLWDLPIGVERDFVAEMLEKHAGIEVLETVSVQEELTGLTRSDAARLLVPADTCLPGSLHLLLPDGTTHTIQVRAVSALPPAPGEQAPRATYADAAAGHGPPPAPVPAGAAWGRAASAPAASDAAGPAAAGPVGAGAGASQLLVGRPARQPSPPSGSGSSHWRGRQGGAAGGASPRQHGPARGGSAAAAAAAGRASPRSRSPPAARQLPPARLAAGRPTGRQDSPSSSTAGSRPVSPTAQTAAKRLRANPFATLSDQEDMDASPDTLLAPRLPGDPTAPDAATA